MTRAIARTALALLFVGAVSNPAYAQKRDVPRPVTGTASVSGTVVADSPTNTPIRRVVVQLSEVAGAWPTLGAITDDDGRFTFPDLPAGTYTLVATRAAYVSSAYGAKTYGRGSGVPISVAAGEAVRDITLKMIRGGVIAGVLRDPMGRPASGASVLVLMSRNENGRRRLVPILQDGQANSRGEYRVFGLMPGDYILRAQPPARYGRPELRQTTAAELAWAQAQSTAGVSASPPANGRPVAYTPTYYPGTNDAATASMVTVGAGEERLGIDFAFQLIPTATLSGRITLPDGQPAKSAFGRLSLEASGTTSAIDAMIGVANTGGFGGNVLSVTPEGRFSVPGLPPGRYRLKVSMPAGGAGREALVAEREVRVDGQDVTGVDVVLGTGLAVGGTIMFEGEDPAAAPDASRATLGITSADRDASSALEMMMSGMSGASMGRATKDRTFTIGGLLPGRYRLTALPPGVINPFALAAGGSTAPSPDGWVFKSAVSHGRDLADGAFELQSGDDISDVVITFSKAVTEISGHLIDGTGRPTAGYPIVVFSTRPADWVGGSRRVISAKPSSDGAYTIRGLPAGEYYLCALADLDVNDLYDASFLEQLATASFKLTLAEGEKKIQDLKIGGGL
jgi:hypothetical protein